jgi:hypothetical protein
MWDIPLNQPTPMFGRPQVSHLADVFGLLARPAKGFAALTGMADPSVAPWLPRKSIIPEKYNYPYGTPPREIEADQHAKMGEQFLGGVGNITKVAPMMGIRAFHGSPHDFDRFDMSKIGTGEGAQAYGHGLYFAEKEGTARYYKNAVGGDVHGYRFPILSENQNAALGKDFMARVHELSVQRGPKEIQSEAQRRLDVLNSTLAMNRANNGRNLQEYQIPKMTAERDALGALLKSGEFKIDAPGKMYEVNLRAKPEEFLDWDKPLSAQGAPVRDLYNQYGAGGNISKFENTWIAKDPKSGWSHHPSSEDAASALQSRLTGSDFYNAVGQLSGRSDATSLMRDAGIPGIRYLDQGSRAAGDGSRNYVLFRDDIIDIVRKYGMIPPMFGRSPGEQ